MRQEFIYRDIEGREIFKKVKNVNAHNEKRYWFEVKTEDRWELSRDSLDPFPYNPDRFKDFEGLVICEGEKDADNVNDLNIQYLATTAPTGAHNWDDGLTPHFKNKSPLIFLYDVGNESDVNSHARELQEAFPETVIKIAKVPLSEREADITDYLEEFPDIEAKTKAFLGIIEGALRFVLEQRTIAVPSHQAQPIIELEVENSFLNCYVNSLSQITDAPRIFLLFSGIALLSGVLNKFYFKYPRRTHLNLYILLLAPSTYYRKSTCTDLVGDYLEESNPDLKLPESFTVEALYDIMRKYPKGLIIWPELIQVKEFQMAKEYNRGLPAFLTDLYDFKKKLKRWTVGNGEIVVEEPVISILAAGITNWFTKNLQAIDFQGGLWTRFLFVPAPTMERRYSPPTPFTLDQAIVRRLNALNDLEGGEINLSRIMPLMQEWGVRHQEQTMRLETEILSAVYQRLEVMLLKLAAIFQISHDQSTVITPEIFREAVKVIEHLKAQLPAFFEEEIQFGEDEKAMGTILKYLRRKRRALKKEILQGTKIPKKFADPALLQLEEEEKIRSEKIPAPSRGGRPGRRYEYVSEDGR